MPKVELYHDNFQNFKSYHIPKAQLVIADIPYNIAGNAYASNPMWYQGGDNKNGESRLAKQSFFHTDVSNQIKKHGKHLLFVEKGGRRLWRKAV